MMGYGWGMGAVGWIFMGLFWIAILGFVVWAVTALLPGNRPADPGRPAGPRQILDRRFAQGEIDVQQYRQARGELADDLEARR
jgi:putative membrane protein